MHYLPSDLARCYLQLGGEGSIVEVGAGNGRLAYHLNATGFLPVPIIATDLHPAPSPSVPGGAFPCKPLDQSQAIAAHGPVSIVVRTKQLTRD